MKSVLFVLSVFVCSLPCFGQAVGDIVRFKTYVEVADSGVTPMDAFEPAADASTNADYLEPNYKFRVVSITDDKVQVTALNFSTGTTQTSVSGEFSRAKIYNYKIYEISKEDFQAAAVVEESFAPVTVGILTLPFKARFSEEVSFDTEFNFNSTVNLNLKFFKKTQVQTHLILGAGLGSVNLNDANSEISEPQDVSTLGFLGGIMGQYDKVQFGVFLGTDFINNQKTTDWDHHGDLWVGIGIGFDIFKISQPKDKQ